MRDSFVCNIGDMLDRMTRGRYRSTPHRVLSPTERSRLSFPFFFDPNWTAEVRPIDAVIEAPDPDGDQNVRWDHESVHDFRGSCGDYVLTKVARVFPDLHRDALK